MRSLFVVGALAVGAMLLADQTAHAQYVNGTYSSFYNYNSVPYYGGYGGAVSQSGLYGSPGYTTYSPGYYGGYNNYGAYTGYSNYGGVTRFSGGLRNRGRIGGLGSFNTVRSPG